MKKSTFFLIIYLLVGCGEKGVSKAYLAGEWYCSLSEYENREMDNEDSWTLVDEFDDIEIYQLVNNKLYLNGDQGKFEFFDIDAKVKNESVEIPLNYGKNGFVKISQKYEKVNENKYMLTMQSESLVKTSINEQNYFRKKFISSCERLK